MTSRTFGLLVLLITCASGPRAVAGGDMPWGNRAPNPLGGGGAVTLQPVPPAAKIGSRRIFVCREGDPVVLSDRPCEQQLLEAQARTEAPHEDAGDTAFCRRIRARLDELDERMRAGYEITESTRLWHQRIMLKRALNRRGC
jgi:hypothetical protein